MVKRPTAYGQRSGHRLAMARPKESIHPVLVLGSNVCWWHNVVNHFHRALDGHIAEGDT